MCWCLWRCFFGGVGGGVFLWWLWGWCLCGSGGCIDYVVVTFLFVFGGAVLVCVLVC